MFACVSVYPLPVIEREAAAAGLMLPGMRALWREWPPAVKWREEKRSDRILASPFTSSSSSFSYSKNKNVSHFLLSSADGLGPLPSLNRGSLAHSLVGSLQHTKREGKGKEKRLLVSECVVLLACATTRHESALFVLLLCCAVIWATYCPRGASTCEETTSWNK